jgi:hypothetical protein
MKVINRSMRIAMDYEWRYPPAPFNPTYDAIKAAKKAKVDKIVKEQLDRYHRTLKHIPNNEYYDLMELRELELRKQFI